MEAGEAYCGLDKDQLNDLVGTLQPKVKQLAEVLSLELDDEEEAQLDYVDIMTAAHRQMGELTEEVVELLGHSAAWKKSRRIPICWLMRRAYAKTVDSFLSHSSPPESSPATTTQNNNTQNSAQSSLTPVAEQSTPAKQSGGTSAAFTTQLTFTIGHCRSKRQPVSVVLLEMSGASSRDAQGPARVVAGFWRWRRGRSMCRTFFAKCPTPADGCWCCPAAIVTKRCVSLRRQLIALKK